MIGALRARIEAGGAPTRSGLRRTGFGRENNFSRISKKAGAANSPFRT
jgi:hypothetical protein